MPVALSTAVSHQLVLVSAPYGQMLGILRILRGPGRQVPRAWFTHVETEAQGGNSTRPIGGKARAGTRKPGTVTAVPRAAQGPGQVGRDPRLLLQGTPRTRSRGHPSGGTLWEPPLEKRFLHVLM